ncbi:hypothetical protein BSPP4475_07800 [Brevibacillus aydinogluensis]|jgi:hypothetical protein|uniref:Uncharacterized protein n=1 Tax=Brevibacillus aydinogluensis TaxID=927786 RepID=A0AA48M8H3_9BACL|nr:hypothetical protein BSPP4475_07800 [Brevibacillus aydinogluensis]
MVRTAGNNLGVYIDSDWLIYFSNREELSPPGYN